MQCLLSAHHALNLHVSLNPLCTSVHTMYWGSVILWLLFFFNSRCDYYIIHWNILHSVLLSALQSCSSSAHNSRVIQTLLCCSFWEQTIKLIKACLYDRVINVTDNTSNASAEEKWQRWWTHCSLNDVYDRISCIVSSQKRWQEWEKLTRKKCQHQIERRSLSIKNNAALLWQAEVSAHWGIIINKISIDIDWSRIQMLTHTCCHLLSPLNLNKAAVNTQSDIWGQGHNVTTMT
jgi:hypothetical protein